MEKALVHDVRARFGGDADTVLELLAEYGSEPFHREVDRVRRAILTLSGDDLDRLLHHLAEAQQDYRDVLDWADNPHGSDEPRTEEEGRAWVAALLHRAGLPPEA